MNIGENQNIGQITWIEFMIAYTILATTPYGILHPIPFFSFSFFFLNHAQLLFLEVGEIQRCVWENNVVNLQSIYVQVYQSSKIMYMFDIKIITSCIYYVFICLQLEIRQKVKNQGVELRYETTGFSNSIIEVREKFYGGHPKGSTFKYFLVSLLIFFCFGLVISQAYGITLASQN